MFLFKCRLFSSVIMYSICLMMIIIIISHNLIGAFIVKTHRLLVSWEQHRSLLLLFVHYRWLNIYNSYYMINENWFMIYRLFDKFFAYMWIFSSHKYLFVRYEEDNLSVYFLFSSSSINNKSLIQTVYLTWITRRRWIFMSISYNIIGKVLNFHMNFISIIKLQQLLW